MPRWSAERERAGAWPRDPDGAPLYPGNARSITPAERERRIEAGERYALAARYGGSHRARRRARLDGNGAGAERRDRHVPAMPTVWGDVVLARKETPTSYHLSVVVDDALQGVTHVVRGQDLFFATGVHRLLQTLLGLPAPVYHHHRLLMDADGRKLSKSTQATGLRELRTQRRDARGYPRGWWGFFRKECRSGPCARAWRRGNLRAAGPWPRHDESRRPDGRAGQKPGRKRAPQLSKRAIETTLAELAHEIRTPLTGILALGELLATAGLPPREREWATAIKSTGEHLTMLTSLIVDAVRADTRGLVLRRDLIRPRAFAQSLAASLDARAQSKNVECDVTIAQDLPEVVIGDTMRLRAALENLIDNAVKFTERGTVRLDVGSDKAARDRIRLIFTVTDSGIGLSAAEIKRLFKPFEQASRTVARRFGGAGLGLSYVKRIARAMGGDLAVTSKTGGGSRFEFSAVVTRVTGAEGAQSSDGDTRGAPSRSLAVLCVEDNPYGRIVLNTILTELGHRADFVGTGEAAVDAVAGGSYDAVLMDVTLPGLDGFEATRRIRALPHPAGAVRIVGVSGRANAADEAAGRAAGMDAYLAKPLSPSALAAVLTEKPA